MSSPGRFRLPTIFSFALLLPVSVVAQSSRPSLEGRVLDPARAPLSGAKISIDADGKTEVFAASSDARGEFSASLAPGQYKVIVEASGFNTITENVTIPARGTAIREYLLALAPAQFTVSVVEGTGYLTPTISSAMKAPTLLRDIPQALTVIPRELIRDQMMLSVGDVVKYVPGIQQHQGENNRDQVIIRGNSSTADFFVNGVRDDVQYYRDLYNLERVEAIKGPNAMIFGRGGGGGVINRVTKEAAFVPLRELSVQGGSFGYKRVTGDFNQPLGTKFAFRMNAMFEDSNSFRNNVGLGRHGVSPTLTYLPGKATKIVLSLENLHDNRVADRGITSFNGLPAGVPIRTFYGNPSDSHVRARVNVGTVTVEHQAGGLKIINRSSFANYDRFYQNYVPGAVNAPQTLLALTAYNNATVRFNFFNQTNLNYSVWTGSIRHTLLGGIELGRQRTDNFRNTGYFNNTVTAINVPFLTPTTTTPVTFRQSATDADNHLVAHLGAAYLQDQVELSHFVQLVGGIRVDQFDLRYHNNRAGNNLRRIDNLVSPRVGIVIKPKSEVSFYGSYSVSYLPSSGDQFSSLTDITQQVKPEKFNNYEAGVKWDIGRSFAFTSAVYRLDRANTRSTDPNDPTRIIQTGSTRTNGVELGVNGNILRRWQIAGGYAYQDGYISSATTSAVAGRQVGQVPHNTFSLWNNYQVLRRLGAGLGIISRSDMFAAVDNTVRLPGYTRLDAAAFYTLSERVRLQVNIENLANLKYYSNADSNTNISPGYPRAVRAGLTWRF